MLKTENNKKITVHTRCTVHMPNCSCLMNRVRDDKKKKKSKHGTWEARNALPKRTLNFRRVMITPRNLFGFNKIKLKKKKKTNLITSMLHEMEKEPNTIRSLIKMEENLIP